MKFKISASSMKMKAEIERASLKAKAAAVMEKLTIAEVSIKSEPPDDKGAVKSTLLTLPPHVTPAAIYPQYHSLNHNLPVGTKTVLTDANRNGNDGEVLDSLCQAITQQANVTEYIVKNHKASLLPELTIKRFKGEPLEYKSFIRSIEHGIESRTEDNRDRLQFLLQYTSGQPHELVKSCIHMSPSIGFAKAKQMFKEYFGDDYKIAEAYIKEVLDWQTIKPEDGEALQSFSLFLTGCFNMMADVSYMEDLDNSASIKALANKLPYKLKES